jgi:hypothetical protein
VAGVSERTVYNRLADPDFRRLIGKYRRAIVDESVGTLARFGKRAARGSRRRFFPGSTDLLGR